MQDARGKYGMSRFHVAIAVVHPNDDGAAARVRVIGIADDSHNYRNLPFCPRDLRGGVIMGKEKRHTSVYRLWIDTADKNSTVWLFLCGFFFICHFYSGRCIILVFLCCLTLVFPFFVIPVIGFPAPLFPLLCRYFFRSGIGQRRFRQVEGADIADVIHFVRMSASERLFLSNTSGILHSSLRFFD